MAGIALGDMGFADAVSAGQGPRATAWPDRAEAAAQEFVKANAQQLANSVQRIAHPEGRRPELTDRAFSNWDNHFREKIYPGNSRGEGETIS